MSSIRESVKTPSLAKEEKEAAREKRIRVAILNLRLQTTKIYKQKGMKHFLYDTEVFGR